MPRHVTPTHKMQRTFLVCRTSVHLVSARPLNNRACLFRGGLSDIKGALLGGSFNHRQTIWIVSAPNKSRKTRFCSELENSRRLLSTLEPSDCNEFWHRPLKIIYLSFFRGWIASEAWKGEKLDKIREAVGLGGPLSLSFTFVGGGDGKRGINGLKTPLSHKKSTYDVG